MIPWEESYACRIGKLVNGQLPVVIPSVRAIICDEQGDVLFIERRKPNIQKSNDWGMPAGSIELGESIYECLCREVKEETGLEVKRATLMAVYTGARGLGEKSQLFEFCFIVDEWSGSILRKTNESTNAHFYPTDCLPPASSEFWTEHHREVLKDLRAYTGQVILKQRTDLHGAPRMLKPPLIHKETDHHEMACSWSTCSQCLIDFCT